MLYYTLHSSREADATLPMSPSRCPPEGALKHRRAAWIFPLSLWRAAGHCSAPPWSHSQIRNWVCGDNRCEPMFYHFVAQHVRLSPAAPQNHLCFSLYTECCAPGFWVQISPCTHCLLWLILFFSFYFEEWMNKIYPLIFQLKEVKQKYAQIIIYKERNQQKIKFSKSLL